MPKASLKVPYQTFMDRNYRHSGVVDALPQLEPGLQKLLAEMVLIRLFDDLQEALSGMAYRLACGTDYLDGSSPTLLTSPARSTAGARALFEGHNRTKNTYVKWSKVSYIKKTTGLVLPSSENFITSCENHSLKISEMQSIRNRIAHKNSDSRKNFDVVLRRYYGAAPKNVTPGLLLLTSRVSPNPLHLYLAATRVIAKECAKVM